VVPARPVLPRPATSQRASEPGPSYHARHPASRRASAGPPSSYTRRPDSAARPTVPGTVGRRTGEACSSLCAPWAFLAARLQSATRTTIAGQAFPLRPSFEPKQLSPGFTHKLEGISPFFVACDFQVFKFSSTATSRPDTATDSCRCVRPF